MSDNTTTTCPSQIALICNFCGHSIDVEWFCKSCGSSLCNTCNIEHTTIPLFKNHSIVPRTNDVIRLYGPSKIAVSCQIHLHKEITTYCNDCQVPCCVTCLAQNHKRHDFSTIEDKYLFAEKRLNINVKELERDTIATLDSMAAKVKNDRSENKARIDGVRDEVNIFRKEMKSAIDQTCDDLLEKLNRNDIEFDRVISTIEAQIVKVRELINEIDVIIQKGDLEMIKYTPPSHRTFIPDVTSPRVTFPVFIPGRDILTIIREKLGTIEWIDEISEPTSNEKSGNSPIKIKKVITFNSKIEITSIRTAGKNSAWVMDCAMDTMYLYDGNGKVVRSMTVKGSKGINDMAIKQSGEIIVSCEDQKVRRISGSCKVSLLIETSPFVPLGVCLTEKEEVVVCLGGQDERNRITVYSSDTGRKLREIMGIDGQGKRHITDPYRMVHNGQDLCVIEHWSKVVCVNEKGDVRWLYDGKQTQCEDSFGPRCIDVDKYHNLLVTDRSNSCIHYIDRDGVLIQIILTQQQTGLYGHWGICTDLETGNVWIGDMRNNIVITKYLA